MPQGSLFAIIVVAAIVVVCGWMMVWP